MGIAFGWGSIMAWAAVRNTVEWPALLIFLATICWATAYDTIYALMDRKEDARIGVKSSALLFGEKVWLAIGILFGFCVLFLVLLGVSSGLGWIYYTIVVFVASCFLYQTAVLRSNLDQARLLSLFKSHVGIGMMLLIGIFLGYALP